MDREQTLVGEKPTQFAKMAAIFKESFPSAEIKPISPIEVPSKVMDHFEFCSELFVNPEDYRPQNFENLFLISHQSGEKTYVAQQTKAYASGLKANLVYLLDMDDSGNKQGEGDIRNSISDKSPAFLNKPFASWYKTEKDYLNIGLGKRRCEMMNALSLMLYQLPLHSDIALFPEGKLVFEALLREGRVDKYLEGNLERYVFRTGKKE